MRHDSTPQQRMPRSSSARRWGLIIAVGLVLAVAGVAALRSIGVAFAGPDRPERTCMGDGAAEEIRIVREWARLAPLPATRERCQVRVEGSSMTRSFRVEFVAPADDIGRWVNASPGLREAHASPATSPTRYPIRPGAGAQGAEVGFRPEGEGAVRVEVYVYWS